jgi:ANTAR domain
MDGPGNDAETLRAARVEMLMAVVRDTVSSLRHASTQLAVELSDAARTEVPSRESDLSTAVDALRTENSQLREALEARALIEQAKGILMAQHACDADAAFTMLSTISRAERRKVRHVAAAVVAGASRASNVVDLSEASSFTASKTVPTDGTSAG